MKSFLTLSAVLSFALGSAFAGCGKVVTDSGILKAVNSQSKTIVVVVDGKEVTRTLTPDSKASGIRKLIGKAVVVTSNHGKVQAVTPG